MLPSITSTNLVTYIFKLLSDFTRITHSHSRTLYASTTISEEKRASVLRAVYPLQLNDTAEEARHGSSIHRTTIIDSCEHETSSAK